VAQVLGAQVLLVFLVIVRAESFESREQRINSFSGSTNAAVEFLHNLYSSLESHVKNVEVNLTLVELTDDFVEFCGCIDITQLGNRKR
jgi:hypothetical protein